MIAQEMPSATRSNKMLTPTRRLGVPIPNGVAVRIARRAAKARRRQDCRSIVEFRIRRTVALIFSMSPRRDGTHFKSQIGVSQEVRCPMLLEILDG